MERSNTINFEFDMLLHLETANGESIERKS